MEDRSFTSRVLFFFSLLRLFTQLSPRRRGERLGLRDAVTRILRIGPSALTGCMFKQMPRRFARPGFRFKAAPGPIRPAHLHGCGCLFGPVGGGGAGRGANLDKADSVYRGRAHVYVQVNAL